MSSYCTVFLENDVVKRSKEKVEMKKSAFLMKTENLASISFFFQQSKIKTERLNQTK